MPFILIIVGIIAALGFGGFLFMQQTADTPLAVDTPVARIEEIAVPATTTPLPTSTPIQKTEPEVTITAPVTPQIVPKPSPSPAPATPAPATPAPAAPTTVYKNGTYTVMSSYTAPGRSNHIVTATIIIKDDIITDSSMSYSGDKVTTSTEYQNKFSKNYQTQVVGKKLDNVSLSRVGGASLTTGAFNKALAEVKTSAQS